MTWELLLTKAIKLISIASETLMYVDLNSKQLLLVTWKMTSSMKLQNVPKLYNHKIIIALSRSHQFCMQKHRHVWCMLEREREREWEIDGGVTEITILASCIVHGDLQ